MIIIKQIKVLRPAYFAGIAFLAIVLFTYEAFSAHDLQYDFDFVGYGGTFKFNDLKILSIPAYWFMMLSGLAISVFISLRQRHRYEYGVAKAIITPVLFLVVAFAGGKLMYIIENLHTVAEKGIQLSGLSLFGAIFLFPLITFLVSKFTTIDFAEMLDYCTPFGIVLLSCTRIGCFISGCCGAVTYWFNGNPVILPVQLIEVMFDLIILEICRYVEMKKFKSGLVYPTFMILYGLCRFVLEFIRRTGSKIFFIPDGMFFAVICVVIGFLLYRYFYKQFDSGNSEKPNKTKALDFSEV